MTAAAAETQSLRSGASVAEQAVRLSLQFCQVPVGTVGEEHNYRQCQRCAHLHFITVPSMHHLAVETQIEVFALSSVLQDHNPTL